MILIITPDDIPPGHPEGQRFPAHIQQAVDLANIVIVGECVKCYATDRDVSPAKQAIPPGKVNPI